MRTFEKRLRLSEFYVILQLLHNLISPTDGLHRHRCILIFPFVGSCVATIKEYILMRALLNWGALFYAQKLLKKISVLSISDTQI